MKMITANEAKALVADSKRVIDEQIAELDKRIRKAASEGKTDLEIKDLAFLPQFSENDLYKGQLKTLTAGQQEVMQILRQHGFNVHSDLYSHESSGWGIATDEKLEKIWGRYMQIWWS